MNTRTRRWAVAIVSIAFIAGCSTSQSTPPLPPTQQHRTSQPPAGGPSAQTPCGTAKAPPKYEHIVWLVMENHGPDQVVGSQDAPYLNSLIEKCGLATNSHAVAHPSLPNYIAMTSGGTQGITNDGPPAQHPLTAESIFSQLGEGKWRSLSQSMPSNCYQRNAGTYVPRHNPATYYVNIVGQCSNQATPLTEPPDLSAPFTFIAPNQRSNTHDTSVSYGDEWLAEFIPTVLDSPEYTSGRTAVVITYDEDENEGNPSNPIATVLIAPSTTPGTRDATYYTHYSLLRTTEELLGLGLLGQAAQATSMRKGFNL